MSKKKTKKSGTPPARQPKPKNGEEKEPVEPARPSVTQVFDSVVKGFENIVQQSGLNSDAGAQAYARAVGRMILLTPLTKEQFVQHLDDHLTTAAQRIISDQSNVINAMHQQAAKKKGGKKK